MCAICGARTAYQTPASPWFLVGFVLLDLKFSLYCFVDRCLSFCPFSFGHCDVCPMASDYSFNIFKLFSQIICTKKTELLMEISE